MIALVGEAGMGKSRLVHELLRAPAIRDWQVLQTGTTPFGSTAAFMPLDALLRSLFGVDEADGRSEIDAKVRDSLSRYRASGDSLLAAVRFLLNLPIDDPTWEALDPQQRRDRIIEELRGFLLQMTHTKPLLLVFEDLHWIDPESQRLLDALAGGLGGQRLLLLVTYRPEYQHGWAGKSYYTRIRVDPLGDAMAQAMLDGLLGHAPELAALKGLLIERTEGRPLFIEELVRSLKDSGTISQSNGSTVLTGSLERIEIPGSVQDVLASRIDRLEPALKRLLQTASVIGRRVPVVLIAAIADAPGAAVEDQLMQLQTREFLYQAAMALDHLPETESRLTDKMDVRLEMRIALWPLGQHETLARRVREAGELAERAGDILRLAWVHNFLTAHHWQAGEHKQAIKAGEKGIQLADQTEDFSVRVTTMQHLGLAYFARGEFVRQTELHRQVALSLVGERALERHGMAGYPAALSRGFLAFGLAELGEFDEALHWAREAQEFAAQVSSAMTSVWVTNTLALSHLMSGGAETAIGLMQPNFELCRRSGVRPLFSQTAGILGHSLSAAGRPGEGIGLLEQAVHPDNLEFHTEGLGYPLVWLASALGTVGRFDDGLALAHRALEIASRQGERGHKAWALYVRAEIERGLGEAAFQFRETYSQARKTAEFCHLRPLATMCDTQLGGA